MQGIAAEVRKDTTIKPSSVEEEPTNDRHLSWPWVVSMIEEGQECRVPENIKDTKDRSRGDCKVPLIWSQDTSAVIVPLPEVRTTLPTNSFSIIFSAQDNRTLHFLVLGVGS